MINHDEFLSPGNTCPVDSAPSPRHSSVPGRQADIEQPERAVEEAGR